MLAYRIIYNRCHGGISKTVPGNGMQEGGNLQSQRRYRAGRLLLTLDGRIPSRRWITFRAGLCITCLAGREAAGKAGARRESLSGAA